MSPIVTIDYHSTAGYRLRHARKQLSFSLRDVASTLNLLVSHVRAIEANRCDALASDEKFLRRVHDYANLVELDASEVVDSYREQSEAIEPMQPLLSASKRRWQRSAWIVAGIVVIPCMSFSGWLLTQSIDSMAVDEVSLKVAVAESVPQQRRVAADQTVASAAVEKLATNVVSGGVGSDEIDVPVETRAVNDKNAGGVDSARLRSRGRPTLAPSQKQSVAAAPAPASAPVGNLPSKSGGQTVTTDSLRSMK